MHYSGNSLGRALRALRKERNLSQEVLSGLAGIGRTHLSMIESGKKNITLETFYRLALAFDMLPSQLMAYIENTQNAIK